MYRNFYQVLAEWEKKQRPEPLMIVGARQTGKTWLIRKFCEETYGDYIYINLEAEQDMVSVFDGNLDPDTILRKMGQLLGRKIDASIPIVLDEIQVCERAITSLKYFCEAEENYRIICAGSLLGVKLERFESSFPVGKVRIAKMYPMDFEEFLLACGEEMLRDGIKEAYETKTPLAEGIHTKALQLYQDYLFVGGMPQMVKEYILNDKNAVGTDPLILKNMQLSYLADMTKYIRSPAEGVKITEVYQSIPRQLAKENPKFKYSEVRPRANKRDFIGPIDWLTASGMVYRICKAEAPFSPLKGYENRASFKIYLSDVGILRSMCGIHYSELLPDSHNIYKGAITENYVVQQMIARGKDLYFYKPSESMEIDLLIEVQDRIIPVEIKSGRHKRSRSLNNYLEKYHPDFAIRISGFNFGFQEGIFSVPLYAAWCI